MHLPVTESTDAAAGERLRAMRVNVVEGDLLEQPVEAIVNPWNRNVLPWWLLLPQGVSGAIKRRAGALPFRELARMKRIPLGGAVHTSAGRLSYRAIIHVAGINLFWTATDRSVRDSVVNAVALAERLGFRTLAFPLIGAGSGRMREDAALERMLSTFERLVSSVAVTVVRFPR